MLFFYVSLRTVHKIVNSDKLIPAVSGIVEIFHWRYKCEKEDIDLPMFDFPTISIATNHFSEGNKLGQGGFGPVYKVLILYLSI